MLLALFSYSILFICFFTKSDFLSLFAFIMTDLGRIFLWLTCLHGLHCSGAWVHFHHHISYRFKSLYRFLHLLEPPLVWSHFRSLELHYVS